MDLYHILVHLIFRNSLFIYLFFLYHLQNEVGKLQSQLKKSQDTFNNMKDSLIKEVRNCYIIMNCSFLHNLFRQRERETYLQLHK